MKNVVRLLLVLILAGTAFFFGWAQLPVPPGSYGVLRSKTHGVDTALIREGEFRWVWYKLIPTNAQTMVFTLKPLTRQVRAAGNLPSAETYAAVAGIKADFSYELAATLSFTLKADTLPSLVRAGELSSQESLEEYEEKAANIIEQFSLEQLRAYAAEDTFLGGIPKDAAVRLAEDIRGAFPDIENLSCTIQQAKYPDLALYTMVRSVYEEYLGSQQAVQAERNLNVLFRFDELERYGELLTKYPVLLEYLALQSPKP
ncbi:hypothetical protein AGMMS4952_26430 [Spirochaetia bacterium]|nr:hypothetical protein AGMMS4952_26430 [Spirochaetia bacterium]